MGLTVARVQLAALLAPLMLIDSSVTLTSCHLTLPLTVTDLNMAKIGMQIVVAAWVYTLGACIGSFLNVVIYRLPAGMSLSKPPSRCPRCETELSMRDNIPVLGWFMLRGKCRYCQFPIAPRYPLIEATVGSVFLIFLFGELLRRGANIPLWNSGDRNTGFWLGALLTWEIASLYLIHCILLVVVLATAMIAWDGHQPVIRLTLFGVLTSLFVGLAFPHFRSVHLLPETSLNRLLTFVHMAPGEDLAIRLVASADWTAGVLAGFIAGRLVLLQMAPREEQDAPTLGVIEIMLLAGSFLGWQAILILLAPVLSGAALLRVVSRWCGKNVEQFVAPGCFFCVMAFILLWKECDAMALTVGIRVVGEQSPAIKWGLWLSLCLGFALLLRYTAAQPDIDHDAVSPEDMGTSDSEPGV